MKKLLFIALFCCGLFAASNAQVLTYTLNNVSGVDWKIGLDDAGPSATIFHTSLAFSPPITGAIFPFFAFPLSMKAKNALGCNAGASALGAGPGTFFSTAACAPGTGVVYNITTTIPFVQYNMDLFFL